MSEQLLHIKPKPSKRERLLDRIGSDPALADVPRIARRFAGLVGENVGAGKLRLIDERNELEEDPDVCHSHDYCDANVFMDEAFAEVMGYSVASLLPDIPDNDNRRWGTAWDYAKVFGFAELALVKGDPDAPEAVPSYETGISILRIGIPGLDPRGEHQAEVRADYWGRNPRLQFLCYEEGNPEPVVQIRYGSDGKVAEVVSAPDIRRFKERVRDPDGDTPWERERDGNPPCRSGDLLRMPSGQTATVMSLRDRYGGDREAFRSYAETYGLLERLNGYPGSGNRVYESLDQAWEANPLTAGTTDPSDFSTVPTKP